MASSKSQEGCTVSGRLPRAVSLTVVGEGGNLQNFMLDQPVRTKDCSSIGFLLRKV